MQGLFTLQTTSGTSVLSLSGVYFASLKLQVSCFVSFVRLLWGVYHHYVLLCSICEKVNICYQSMIVQKGEHIWSTFQYTEATANTHSKLTNDK